MHHSDTVAVTQRTETHAYGIPHVDKPSTPPCKFITTDIMSANIGLYSIQESDENRSVSDVKHEYVSPVSLGNLDAIETLSSTTDLSTTLGGGHALKTVQVTYGNEPLKYSAKLSTKFLNEFIDQSNVIENKEADENTRYLANTDHVYEEVHAFECDIMDYYEKYSPTTAKTLINTLFLPRQKICKQCASLQNSPVYSDQLVYGKKPLYAKEVDLFQQNDAVSFKYCSENGNGVLFSQYDNTQHCLLVYTYTKTNASSIFYFNGSARDTFDVRTSLTPNILLVNGRTKGVVNTDLFHRCGSNYYTRISNNGVAPAFRVDQNNILSSIKHVGYDTDLQNWMNYRNDVFRSHRFKQDDPIEHRANRSSLLLLEPLLLMPDFTRPRNGHRKNRYAQSEHMKIVKIVIAYTLSFFILATITFYIVYFT